ncbi:juvenile hormone esterase-like [Leguminivora glycinivorella]|uniref:juvenile hormone esterase-like n=1 Tax=Leguminivora glycinivorella TaxID=1035111 RepID=UPI00200D1E72|nr:juvenile hormone esterase-like [Leguminivora glycinivorella]
MLHGAQAIKVVFYLIIIIIEELCHASVTETTLDPASLRPVVHTPAGSFRGLQAQDGNYSMFLGIPYAKVDPDNIFGPSIPVRFENIFEAVDDSVRCPQVEEFNNTIMGKLDCLHINIHVPHSASIDNPLPVMIHLYGGRFQFGCAARDTYGPRFLIRHDVIVITFNYRLGPYGFFCLNTSKVPGNQGLKDQVQALRWIKGNIRYFGGDDSKITVEGSSAGSMSIDLHQRFLNEPLYSRVILKSGTLLSNGVTQRGDLDAPLKLAKQLNYTTNDINDALLFLSRVDPHELIAATTDLDLFVGPCVEKKFENVDNYITRYPPNVKNIRDVDVLIGFTNDEGFAGIIPMGKEEYESKDFVSELLDAYYDFRNESKLSKEVKQIVQRFYFSDDINDANNTPIILNTSNPTPKPSKLVPLQWPRVSQGKLPYLEINTELRLGSRPMHERMSFIDLLYHKATMFNRAHTCKELVFCLLVIALEYSEASLTDRLSDTEPLRPIVHTPVGSFRGLRAPDGDYSMFLAIMNNVKDVDVLIGFNNDEEYVKIMTMSKEEFESKDFVSELLEAYDFKNESKLLDEMKQIVRSFYYGGDLTADNRRPGVNIFADFRQYNPILRTVGKYLNSGINMYLYMFSYSGERSFCKDKDNVSYTEGGAAHADELGYLFDISYMKERLRDEDMFIVDVMTELWTNFAKYGNPTPKPSKLVPLQWPRVSHDKLPYLEINTELRLGSRPMHERMSFLDLLYKHIGHYHKEHSWTGQ